MNAKSAFKRLWSRIRRRAAPAESLSILGPNLRKEVGQTALRGSLPR